MPNAILLCLNLYGENGIGIKALYVTYLLGAEINDNISGILSVKLIHSQNICILVLKNDSYQVTGMQTLQIEANIKHVQKYSKQKTTYFCWKNIQQSFSQTFS